MALLRRTTMLALAAAGLLPAGANRILAPIDPLRTVSLRSQVHPLAQQRYDQGPADPAMPLPGITLLFQPAASIEPFLAELQDPSSANFHRWLTPEQFADRFGLSADDVARVTAWLRAQGFRIQEVARGRHWIIFSGTADQAGRAFHTQIRRYQVDGKMHYANATGPAVPAALAGVVSGISGLSDFRWQPQHVVRRLTPDYNIGSGHYLAPDDIATIYNIRPLYDAGIDGTGQSLAVVGESRINLSDLRSFRSKFGLARRDPQQVLTGPDPGFDDNTIIEAHLDLEWAGAVARNANLIYVYATDVTRAVQYAVDQNLAPAVTMSFGYCELETSQALRGVAQQANAQGITWLNSSGDNGAASCDNTSPTPQASKGVTAHFPSTLPEVTSVGGTEFNEGDEGSLWAPSNSPTLASALSYIPETPWNDSAIDNALTAGGGGPSAVFPKPVWQTGPGVPADGARDTPDVSLAASADHDGYIAISDGSMYLVGGTSVSSPVFAGIVTLLNHYLAANTSPAQPGLGNINPTLYRLAQSAPEAFHDITEGDNLLPCVQGSPDCVDGQLGFRAGPGYDMATGLGSVDAFRLVTKWSLGTTSSTTVTAAPSKFGLTDSVQLTATVTAAAGSTATPSGTVTFLTSETVLGTAALASSGGTTSASLAVTGLQLAAGNGTVAALYGGDAVFNGSGGSATVSVNLPSSGSLVVPLISPNPIYPQSPGPQWAFTVTLVEKAGVASTLTGWTISGSTTSLSFFNSTSIPAGGSVSSVSLVLPGLTPPASRVFRFTGADADGRTWSQQVTVQFLGSTTRVLNPSITLTTTAPVLQQDAHADPSCQWLEPLTVQEKGGFSVVLTKFTAGSGDFSSSIQAIFGTTRLAPFGTLQGAFCWSASDGPSSKQYSISGTTEISTTVSASLNTTLQGPSPSPAAASASTQAITIPLADASQSGSGTVDLTFAGGSPQWTVSAPSTWLVVSPSSGTGSATLHITASGAGLSRGVYRANVSIQATNAIPQVLTVPVTCVVGASTTTTIGGVLNGASFQPAFAPGMILSVFGSNLAPGVQQAGGLPLPLSLAGVSATVNGIAAPLYYVSSGQINLQVPYEAGAGTAVLGINNNGQVASFSFPLTVSAPGIFTATDGSLVPNLGGRQGDIVLAFITGEGDVTPTLATGAAPAADTPLSQLPQPRQPLTLTVGGVTAQLYFEGIPYGLAGVTQINFYIPSNAPLGPQPVVVTVGGVRSQAATLNVTAAQ